jgi:hypothetical protein
MRIHMLLNLINGVDTITEGALDPSHWKFLRIKSFVFLLDVVLGKHRFFYKKELLYLNINKRT